MFDSFAFWVCVGFAGQLLFTSRFLVQWLVSEQRGESVMPIAFWYLSLGGGSLLLAYAISRRDPVIITGQMFGVVVYLRNLLLIHRSRDRTAQQIPKIPEASADAAVAEAADPPELAGAVEGLRRAG